VEEEVTGEKKEIVCPGTPHRGHFHDDEPCPLVEARGLKEPDPLEGLLIDRFMNSAKYAGKCSVDPSHTWQPGDQIGLAVYDNEEGHPPFKPLGWVCHACRTGITHPESRRG
jgi:hypothetical protein